MTSIGSRMEITTITWRSLVLLVLLVSHGAQALRQEGESLMRFKSRVIDRLGKLADWGNTADIDPCGNPAARSPVWTGVTCVVDEGIPSRRLVTELDLQSLLLDGSISADFVDLTNLWNLYLGGNSFSGQIPDNIIKLGNLTRLDLGDNLLTGTVPQLPPTLVELHLQNNFLIGDIDRTNLFDLPLSTLDLHGNSFTGKLPRLFNETRLRSPYTLDLSHNKIQGTLPLDLGYRWMEQLDLSHNEIEGEIPDGHYDWHSYIDLSGNNLTGKIMFQTVEDLAVSRIRYLNLSRNSLSGMVNFRSNKLNNIQFLDLSFNELENEADVEIGDQMVEVLEYLDLRNNRFSGSLNRIFRGNFSTLRELRVGGNNFQSGDLALTMTSRGFNFPSLQVLDLSGSGLAGRIPSNLFENEHLPDLTVLDLSSNSLHGPVPSNLALMPKLRELRLGQNRLQGAIYTNGRGNLQVMDLGHNSFHFEGAEIQSIFRNYRSLRELRLGGKNPNRTGLPTAVEELLFLEILDLSSCNLMGSIPEQFTRTDLLPSLKYFNLSGNSLQGAVPAGFGRMPELLQLNVSNNKLSGELPAFQYRVFNRTSFSRNEGLCGPPLDACPQGSSSTLSLWQILVLVAAVVIASGGSCLLLGWIWRRKVDAKKQAQDAELIATLLDRDATSLMPLRQLRKATDDFAPENEIGVGGFGTVYRGVLEDGTVVAIKKSKRDGSSSKDKSQFLNEVSILSQVHHRNLVRLLGCCLANRNALLVLEFVPNGTLEEHLHQKNGRSPLTWNQRLLIAIQTAGALDYLHSSATPPIYHLDVKSANILLDHNLNAKVADFGISKLAPAPDVTHITTLHGLQGTFGYMDPEMVVKSMLTDKSDVYAFGVVLLEIITAQAVLKSSRGEEDASLVKWAERLMRQGMLEEIVDPVILDTFHRPDGNESINAVAGLAQWCLQFRSEDRPRMKDVSRDLHNIMDDSVPSVSRWFPAGTNEKILLEMSSSFKGGFTV